LSHIHPAFAEVIATLHHSYERLLAMEPVTGDNLPKAMPKAGVYLFTEGRQHLYVGRSKKLRQRLSDHFRMSSGENNAAFAFKMARVDTRRLRASYGPVGSREALMEDGAFRASFEKAKERIRRMEVRFVEEPDPVRQAVLEVYVAVVLKTPYNDFDTH
jgi:hypothetical protein